MKISRFVRFNLTVALLALISLVWRYTVNDASYERLWSNWYYVIFLVVLINIFIDFKERKKKKERENNKNDNS